MMPIHTPVQAATPTWSVMIPVYKPGKHFELTIGSVLSARAEMGSAEILVVDDCSPPGDVSERVRNAAGDRIGVIRRERNGGLAACWNDCIRLAKGRLVHILHQDDLVYPGFYAAFADFYRSVPKVGMMFCRHEFVDAEGARMRVSDEEQMTGGVLINWLGRIAAGQRIQCPAVVVPRSTYAEVGVFRDDLKFVIDWEMWIRIAARFEVGYIPQVLAAYRVHGGSETAALSGSGLIPGDFDRALRAIRTTLRDSADPNWREHLAASCRYATAARARQVQKAIEAGDLTAALRAMMRRLSSFLRYGCYGAAYSEFKWAAKVVLRMAKLPVRV